MTLTRTLMMPAFLLSWSSVVTLSLLKLLRLSEISSTRWTNPGCDARPGLLWYWPKPGHVVRDLFLSNDVLADANVDHDNDSLGDQEDGIVEDGGFLLGKCSGIGLLADSSKLSMT